MRTCVELIPLVPTLHRNISSVAAKHLLLKNYLLTHSHVQVIRMYFRTVKICSMALYLDEVWLYHVATIFSLEDELLIIARPWHRFRGIGSASNLIMCVRTFVIGPFWYSHIARRMAIACKFIYWMSILRQRRRPSLAICRDCTKTPAKFGFQETWFLNWVCGWIPTTKWFRHILIIPICLHWAGGSKEVFRGSHVTRAVYFDMTYIFSLIAYT